MGKLNPAYLKQENITACAQLFDRSDSVPSVQLQKVLSDDAYAQLKQQMETLPYAPVEDPMHYKYKKAALPEDFEHYLNSAPFIKFISNVLGRPVTRVIADAYCFEWKHYTILHDDKKSGAGVDIIIDVTDNWDSVAGGSVIYADGSGEYTRIEPIPNTLVLVERKPLVQKFVHYLNHYSEGRKRLLIMGTVE